MKDDFWGLEEKIIGDKKKRHLERDFEEAYNGEDFEFENKQIVKNIWWYYIVIILVFSIVFIRAFDLQIVKGKNYRLMAEGNRIRQKNIDAPRGLVYDSKGKVLTENIPQFVLNLTTQDLPKNDKEREENAIKISNETGLGKNDLVIAFNFISYGMSGKSKDRETVAKKIAKKTNLEKNNILNVINSFETNTDSISLIKNIEREKAIILKEKLSGIKCLSVDEKLNRQYVANMGLSHIFGYIGKISEEEYQQQTTLYAKNDYIGKTGLEYQYENVLKGQKGVQQVEVDAAGNVIQVLAQKEAAAGKSIVLGINSDLQKKMYDTLVKYSVESKSKAAVGIAMNPQTGEILSSVSLPDYDNNIFTLTSGKEFNTQYNKLINDSSKPLLNRSVNGIYPPGSTIKPLVASAGLSENVINSQTTIFDPGKILVPNKYNSEVVYQFPDWKVGGHGAVNVTKAIAESCDIFFYAVGGGWDKISGLGSKKLEEYFQKFGLGSKTGIDIPSENAGLVPNEEWKQKVKKESWYQGDTYHMSIGQGDLLTTPLQLVNYISTIANGGNLMTPHIVSKITNVKGKVVKDQTTMVKKRQLVSQEVVEIVRQGMRQTVTSGTAKSLSSLPIEIAGKTGTAQFENNTSLHSWFVSFAPFNNPEIAMVILFEGGGEGHEVALPATKDILSYYFGK